jgi:hemoglobin-like flavoprotein
MRDAVPAQNSTPTEKDLDLVRNSFDHVVETAGVAADLFYMRLFEIAPRLRHLFPEDMRDQKRKLLVMIAMAVQGLHDLDRLLPQLKALGARHTSYGVQTHHYQAVGAALIWALERCLGNAFTPDVQQAWTRVYGLIASVMQQGASEVATMRAAE